MKRKSARMLGDMIGKTAAEVNKLLNEKGYLSGEPGNWSMTDKGREHGEERHKDNGYGGWAARSWSFPMWDEDVAYDIGDPDGHRQRVNENRKKAGLPPLSDED